MTADPSIYMFGGAPLFMGCLDSSGPQLPSAIPGKRRDKPSAPAVGRHDLDRSGTHTLAIENDGSALVLFLQRATAPFAAA